MAQSKGKVHTQGFFASIILMVGALTLQLGCTSKNSDPGADGQAQQGVRELRVFTWSDYLSPEIVKEFEKENNAKVIMDFFSTNEEMLAKVQATVQSGSRGYDVVFPSDYMSANMAQLGILKPLDKSKLTFLKEFNKDFLNPTYDPGLTYVVPYSWGTTGIAVNTKLAKDLDLSKGISWKTMLEDPRFSGQITLLDDLKENLHVALMVQGKKWEAAQEQDIRDAFQYLKAHKKNVKIYTSEPKSIIENNECTLCQVFSGDALRVMSAKPEIRYFIPQEGATIWTDNLAIPKNAKNVELAHAFMNKLLSTQSAKRFTEQTFFPSPNAQAMKLLDPKLNSNPEIFPKPETFKKLNYLTEKPSLLTLMDKLWTELKSM